MQAKILLLLIINNNYHNKDIYYGVDYYTKINIYFLIFITIYDEISKVSNAEIATYCKANFAMTGQE